MSIELDLSFWEIVFVIVFVLGVGVVSGRILGVHRGFVRATVAGIVGSFVGFLLGALRVIDPTVDLASAAAVHLGSSMDVSPASAKEAAQKELLRSLPSLRALPGLTEDVALQLRSGRIRLQVDAFSGPGRANLTRWMDQPCSPRWPRSACWRPR